MAIHEILAKLALKQQNLGNTKLANRLNKQASELNPNTSVLKQMLAKYAQSYQGAHEDFDSGLSDEFEIGEDQYDAEQNFMNDENNNRDSRVNQISNKFKGEDAYSSMLDAFRDGVAAALVEQM